MFRLVVVSLLFIASGDNGCVARFELSEGGNAVAKVVALMNKMREELEKEQTEDQELHEKMECWCTTNSKEKTAVIDEAEATINQLTADIAAYAGQSGALKAEIAQTEKNLAATLRSLEEAVAQRGKENEAFSTEEKDMIEVIATLKSAVKVLSKHHGGSFLELESKLKAQIAVHMPKISSNSPYRNLMQKDLWDMFGSLNGLVQVKQKISAAQVFNSMFLGPREENNIALSQQPSGGVAGAKSYNSQSGEIFGILNQMQEEFEEKLSEAQQNEATAVAQFEKFKKAATEQAAAQKKAIATKKSEKAAADESRAQAKQAVEDTKDALDADQKFMLDLQKRCENADNEFNERQKNRGQEIAAVGEAIAILTDDESRDLFSRTKMGFVQINKSLSSQRVVRERASERVQHCANKTHNLELMSLAVAIKLDAFARVKKAMDKMISELKRQQEDEYQHREFCSKELDTNEDSTRDKSRTKADLEANIADSTNRIETLTSEITSLNTEIEEMRAQMKKAGETREAENKEFQTIVADQRATVHVLNKAIERLKQFYAVRGANREDAIAESAGLGDALVQQSPGQGNSAPPKAKSYNKSSSAPGLLAMIENVIADAKAMENEVTIDEQNAQAAYEEEVTNTNASVKAKQEEIVNKSSIRAEAGSDKASAEGGHDTVVAELDALAKYNAELHSSCDFVMNNFQVRQQARQEEIESIQEAKAILSGAV